MLQYARFCPNKRLFIYALFLSFRVRLNIKCLIIETNCDDKLTVTEYDSTVQVIKVSSLQRTHVGNMSSHFKKLLGCLNTRVQ